MTEGFLGDPLVLAGFEDFTLLCRRAQTGTGGLDAVGKAASGLEDVQVADKSADLSTFRIDGPETAEIPRQILGGQVAGMRIMTIAEADVGQRPLNGRADWNDSRVRFFLFGRIGCARRPESRDPDNRK